LEGGNRNGNKGEADNGHNQILNAEGQPRADKRDTKQDAEDSYIHHQIRVLGKNPFPSRSESENIHGYGQSLGQVERDTDAAAYLQPE